MPATTGYTTVDEYIATFPKEVQAVLEKVRATIRKAVPDAEESISYRIAAYRFHGRLIYFAAFQNHYSLYPATQLLNDAFEQQLTPYEVSKGTIRFPYGRPVPVRLIGALAKHRAAENLEAEAAKAAVIAAKKTVKKTTKKTTKTKPPANALAKVAAKPAAKKPAAKSTK